MSNARKRMQILYSELCWSQQLFNLTKWRRTVGNIAANRAWAMCEGQRRWEAWQVWWPDVPFQMLDPKVRCPWPHRHPLGEHIRRWQLPEHGSIKPFWLLTKPQDRCDWLPLAMKPMFWSYPSALLLDAPNNYPPAPTTRNLDITPKRVDKDTETDFRSAKPAEITHLHYGGRKHWNRNMGFSENSIDLLYVINNQNFQ